MSFDDEISIEGMVGGANRGPIDDEVAAKPTYQIGAANQGLVDDAMTPDDEALENESDEDSASEFAGRPSEGAGEGANEGAGEGASEFAGRPSEGANEGANEGASEGASQPASQPAENRKKKLSLSLRRKPKQ